MAEQAMAATGSSGRQTGYPYIVKVEDEGEGLVLIAGTDLPVWVVVESYYRGRLTVEEIAARWSLRPAQIYSALTYYHDHADEIELNKVAAGGQFNEQIRYDLIRKRAS
jgi:uncharacterized protein (DUF433 family)